MFKKIKDRFKRWYTRPRSSYIFGLSNWIMTEPKAMDILMMMGHSTSTVIFSGLTILSFIFWGWLPRILFGVCTILTGRNLYKHFKLRKVKLDYSLNEMIFKNKYNK